MNHMHAVAVVEYPLAAVIKVTEQCVHQSPSQFLVFLSPGGWRNVMMLLELRSIPFGYSYAALAVLYL
jgi:hypothetical protein